MPYEDIKNHLTKNDILIKVEENEDDVLTCKICKTFKGKNRQSLAGHIGSKHGGTIEEYLVVFYLNGTQPLCPICNEKTRLRMGQWAFKKYCINHANEARKKWSQENKTFDYGWKKGLTKETNTSIMKQSIAIGGKNNGSSLSCEDFDNNKANILKKGFEIVSNFETYINNTTENIHAKCLTCNNVTITYLNYLQKVPVCRFCIPAGSKEQKEVYDFIKSIYNGEVIENCRNIISPKELDIYIPDKNFAVEYNGLYHHTYDENDFTKNDKKRHLKKTLECQKKGIQLFHIFSDEWINKKDIVKSMIKHRLGLTLNKIGARKCEIRIVNKIDGTKFFKENHISGDSKGQIYFGLYYNEELISCLSLKEPIQKKYGNVFEIMRFANKLNTNIPGSFQKLFNKAIEYAKIENKEAILTYADRRFGEGLVYKQSGFSFIGTTPVDYWYVKKIGSINERLPRFKYRAQKPLTEKQVAEKENVAPIYGCGSNIYLLKIK